MNSSNKTKFKRDSLQFKKWNQPRVQSNTVSTNNPLTSTKKQLNTTKSSLPSWNSYIKKLREFSKIWERVWYIYKIYKPCPSSLHPLKNSLEGNAIRRNFSHKTKEKKASWNTYLYWHNDTSIFFLYTGNNLRPWSKSGKRTFT